MTSRVRTAVVGLGYFGSFHARHYALNPDAELVAVVDADGERARVRAGELGCEAMAAHRDLFGKVDAVSIAAPTSLHYDIARECIEAGLDVFVEKPIAETVEQANALIDAARQRKVVLQVGHIERFSTVFGALKQAVSKPMLVEARRLVPFRPRANDVSVVSDLMIHDIDLVLDLVGSEPVSVTADGLCLVNRTADHVTARIGFANRAAAILTAGRVGTSGERTLRVMEEDRALLCDLQNSKLSAVSVNGLAETLGEGAVGASEGEVERHDNLGAEIAEFLSCCAQRGTPTITGETGRNALAIVQQIEAALGESVSASAQELSRVAS
ncbi:Gfo/Idh/MocA family protein [Tepidamorphus sp. 3E244]|uniref:Gfo/Idh/MocA family protein n=1 Tax=Tepidamorphus sp. 3E244 TaxID=3385498 RepID=UPI0038FC038A